jgi:hypothetical protein
MRKNSPVVIVEDVIIGEPSIAYNLQKAYNNPVIVSYADHVVTKLVDKEHDLIIFEPYPPDKFSVKIDGDYMIFFEDEQCQDTVLYMKNSVYSQTPLIIALPLGEYNFQGIKTFTVEQLKASYDQMFSKAYHNTHKDQ